MLNMQVLDDLAHRIADLMPGNMQNAKTDVEKTIRATLQAGLSKMNLVVREEFDVHRTMLMRTREKIEALEAQVAELEAKLSNNKN